MNYMMQFFEARRVPEPEYFAAVCEAFQELAEHLELLLPGNPEKTTALRKLLEAKDCAVRALIFKV